MSEQEVNGQTLEGLAQRLELLERENGSLRREVAALRGSDSDRRVEPAYDVVGVEDEKPTVLQELAQRLGALEHKNAELRHKVATLESTSEQPQPRDIIITADVVNARRAVNTFALGVANGAEMSMGSDSTATLSVGHIGAAPAVKADHANGGMAVQANSFFGRAVQGNGVIGVAGTSNTTGEAGVYGSRQTLATAVSEGPGVVGDGKGNDYAGVLGRNSSAGTGVRGYCEQGHGVSGHGVIGVYGSSSTTGEAAVYGTHGTEGTPGPGVVGDGTGNRFPGVLGRNEDGGFGVEGQSEKGRGVHGYGIIGVSGASGTNGQAAVYGTHAVDTSEGPGIVGDGTGSAFAGVWGRNSSGYGGQFEGGKAQLKLLPGTAAGKPSGAHTKGELYMDSEATLFVCTADGTPGTWKRFTTSAAP